MGANTFAVMCKMMVLLYLQSSSVQCGRTAYENLLRASQKEVLWLQRRLSVTSSRQQHNQSSDGKDGREENTKEVNQEKVHHTDLCLHTFFIRVTDLCVFIIDLL